MNEVPVEQLLEPLKKVKVAEPTHMLSMTVMVTTEEEWRDVRAEFDDTVNNLGPDYPSLSVSSTRLDPVMEDEEATTLLFEIPRREMTEKVAEFLYAHPGKELSPADFVDRLLKDGVVFVRDNAPVSKEEFWNEETIARFKGSLKTSGIFNFDSDVDAVADYLQDEGFIVKERRTLEAPSKSDSQTVYHAMNALMDAGIEKPDDIVRILDKAGILLKERA